MNARSKGLSKIHEVKRILEAANHKVEGPKFSIKMGKSTHDDFFSCFDLLSCPLGGHIIGHQVTSLSNKSSHARKIFKSGFNGDLWCYVSRKGFNRYWVHNDNGEMRIELLEEGIKPKKEVKP